MEELEALRKMVEAHDYSAALALIDEMDEMAKDDKIVKIESFLKILLIHLIKKQAEKRTTKSWERSIRNAKDGVQSSNKRRNSKGFYLSEDNLQEAIDEIFNKSLRDAADEAFEGDFSAKELAQMINEQQIKTEALSLILNYKD